MVRLHGYYAIPEKASTKMTKRVCNLEDLGYPEEVVSDLSLLKYRIVGVCEHEFLQNKSVVFWPEQFVDLVKTSNYLLEKEHMSLMAMTELSPRYFQMELVIRCPDSHTAYRGTVQELGCISHLTCEDCDDEEYVEEDLVRRFDFVMQDWWRSDLNDRY